MAIVTGRCLEHPGISLPEQSVLAIILSPRIVPNVSVHRPDYLLRSVTGVWTGHPNSSKSADVVKILSCFHSRMNHIFYLKSSSIIYG